MVKASPLGLPERREVTPENGKSEKTTSGRKMKSWTSQRISRGGKKMLSTDRSDWVNALSWLVDTNKVEWTVDPRFPM